MLCGKPILQLTERVQTDDDVIMSPEERAVYDAIETKQRLEFSRFYKNGTGMCDYFARRSS